MALRAEAGLLAPVFHTIRLGSSGTRFDYVDDGGQDVLFPYLRLQAEALLGAHVIAFLYQPLDLQTKVVLLEDETFDELRFPAGTPVDLRYGFTFWRATYLYDFADGPDREVALGAGLQLRNATLTFTSADGSLRRAERDVGPVPLLTLRGRLPLGDSGFLGAEAAGLYAPIRYLNGGDSDVEGAILDAAVQLGLAWRAHVEAFVTVRYLAGGAQGTSRDEDDAGDGFTSNWLVGSSRVDLQACKLEYSIVSPK